MDLLKWTSTLRRRLNTLHMNRLRFPVVRSDHCHLLPRKRLRFFLIVQLIHRFVRHRIQNKRPARSRASHSTILRVLIPFLLHHRIVRRLRPALVVHHLALERHRRIVPRLLCRPSSKSAQRNPRGEHQEREPNRKPVHHRPLRIADASAFYTKPLPTAPSSPLYLAISSPRPPCSPCPLVRSFPFLFFAKIAPTNLFARARLLFRHFHRHMPRHKQPPILHLHIPIPNHQTHLRQIIQ